MSNIVVWGAGKRTETCFKRNMWGNDNKILAIIESSPSSKEQYGYPVIAPEAISELIDYDYVVINNQYFYEIIPLVLELGIPIEKIIITDNSNDEPYKSCFERAQKVIPQIYEMNKLVIKQTVKLNERDLLDDSSIFVDLKFSDYEYKSDYFRYRTFEFVAEQIEHNNIEGELAEFGVFRGLFSAVISSKFPEKKIYLFDTFEGFDDAEAKRELELGNCKESFLESHKDTSVERMLGNLPYPENAVVCKGFFPKSVTEEAKNEKYAFVSLDVDFEESTLEGLRFFYHRLSEGGYIFIHDYNTQYLKGVKNAVDRFEKEIGCKLKKVPLADRAGTLIIVK